MQYIFLCFLFISIIGGVSANQADIIPTDGLWNNARCSNPRFSSSVASKRIKAYADLLYDISSDGHVMNIRVKESSPPGLIDKAAIKAIKRWKYFAFMDNGIEAPRKDVEITFTYGGTPDEGEATCTHTPWPQASSSIGHINDPYNQLRTCHTLAIPRMAAHDRVTGRVDLQFNISKQGIVRDINVVQSSQKNTFTNTSIAALRRWRYHPYIQTGKATARDNLAVTFFYGELPDKASPHPCSFASWTSGNTITQIIEKAPWTIEGMENVVKGWRDPDRRKKYTKEDQN